MPGEHLVLYDGVCGLCNAIVQFVLRRDHAGVFHFASLQSTTGREWLKRFERNPEKLDTFAVVIGYRTSTPTMAVKAAGVLFLLRHLGQPWRILAVAGVLPHSMLNWIYDLVARYRYRVFGRYDVCVLPAPDQRERFLDG
jgi:predicted DCC family thiol-disulfide oxidoreductase YuxK